MLDILPFRPLPALPIFRADQDDHSLFYAPGYLVAVAASQAEAFSSDLLFNRAGAWPEADTLRRHAAHALRAWNARAERPYGPVCLTLYLNNECNLRCSYCYTMPALQRTQRLSAATARAGAEVVAPHCRSRSLPLTLVLHGGGEPALDREQVDSVLVEVQAVAEAFGLPLFRYIATNGVMSAARAEWLAERFDLVGLSCDGPDDIQNVQRPRVGGGTTTNAVERTADIIRRMGTALHVRVTVTRSSADRQREIAEYVCARLQPAEIHVEPVYRIGRGDLGDDSIDDARAFVSAFLAARKQAQRYGVRWITSGSRPDEIHGPYCHVFRDVLQLVPGDAATACFVTTTASAATATRRALGSSKNGASLTLDSDHVRMLQAALSAEPDHCRDCFNRFHCVRACPEYCPLTGGPSGHDVRCQVQRTLISEYLREIAGSMRNQMIDVAGQPVQM